MSAFVLLEFLVGRDRVVGVRASAEEADAACESAYPGRLLWWEEIPFTPRR